MRHEYTDDEKTAEIELRKLTNKYEDLLNQIKRSSFFYLLKGTTWYKNCAQLLETGRQVLNEPLPKISRSSIGFEFVVIISDDGSSANTRIVSADKTHNNQVYKIIQPTDSHGSHPPTGMSIAVKDKTPLATLAIETKPLQEAIRKVLDLRKDIPLGARTQTPLRVGFPRLPVDPVSMEEFTRGGSAWVNAIPGRHKGTAEREIREGVKSSIRTLPTAAASSSDEQLQEQHNNAPDGTGSAQKAGTLSPSSAIPAESANKDVARNTCGSSNQGGNRSTCQETEPKPSVSSTRYAPTSPLSTTPRSPAEILGRSGETGLSTGTPRANPSNQPKVLNSHPSTTIGDGSSQETNSALPGTVAVVNPQPIQVADNLQGDQLGHDVPSLSGGTKSSAESAEAFPPAGASALPAPTAADMEQPEGAVPVPSCSDKSRSLQEDCANLSPGEFVRLIKSDLSPYTDDEDSPYHEEALRIRGWLTWLFERFDLLSSLPESERIEKVTVWRSSLDFYLHSKLSDFEIWDKNSGRRRIEVQQGKARSLLKGWGFARIEAGEGDPFVTGSVELSGRDPVPTSNRQLDNKVACVEPGDGGYRYRGKVLAPTLARKFEYDPNQKEEEQTQEGAEEGR